MKKKNAPDLCTVAIAISWPEHCHHTKSYLVNFAAFQLLFSQRSKGIASDLIRQKRGNISNRSIQFHPFFFRRYPPTRIPESDLLRPHVFKKEWGRLTCQSYDICNFWVVPYRVRLCHPIIKFRVVLIKTQPSLNVHRNATYLRQ